MSEYFKFDLGTLCCFIGIISSVGSIISNLADKGYRTKINRTEILIEKNDLEKLHNDTERLQKELEEIKLANKELRDLVKELKNKKLKNKQLIIKRIQKS